MLLAEVVHRVPLREWAFYQLFGAKGSCGQLPQPVLPVESVLPDSGDPVGKYDVIGNISSTAWYATNRLRCVVPPRRAMSAFYSVLVHQLAVLTPLCSVHEVSLRSFPGPLARPGHSPSLPSPGWSPFPSWLQMVVSSFSCSGISTGDLNPVYNVLMLGTHNSRHATPISRPVYIPLSTFNLNPVIDARPR